MAAKEDTTNERKERAERRKKAREDGLFTTLDGIEEYYLEIEGYTREEAEPLIIRECQRRNIDYEKKTWVKKRVDDAKVVFALVKEHPEEAKIIAPMIVTALTSLFSFAAGALSQKDDKSLSAQLNKHEQPQSQQQEQIQEQTLPPKTEAKRL